MKRGTQTEEVREEDVRENILNERDEVTGGWRGLHKEEHHNLYFSPSLIIIVSRVEAGKNTSTVIPASRKRQRKWN
jgi:hypothetical protein